MESWYTPIHLFKIREKHFIGKLHCFTDRRVDTRLGSEFMPPLDEGSILFMPVTYLMYLILK
jgi:Cu(I)/Ag(I) efflux system membrane protein CusA/SilA